MRDTAPILLCYDRSAGSRHTIATAGAQFPGRKAIVLHIWSPLAILAAARDAGTTTHLRDARELEEAALEFAREGVRMAIEAGLDAQPEIVAATHGIRHGILATADRHDAGIIVLGARELSTFPFPPGSVTYEVAQHSKRPVLLVPALHARSPRGTARDSIGSAAARA